MNTHMSANGLIKLKVKFVHDDAYGFKKGEIYEAFECKSKFGKEEMLCIVDKSGEEYGYPASWFEICK